MFKDKEKILRNFYLLSYFMLCNSLLFGFILRSIGISFWRQIIFFIGILFFYFYVYKIDFKRLAKFNAYFRNSIILIVVCSLITIFIFKFSFIRIAFSAVNYIYGFAFLSLAYVFRHSANRFFIFKYFAFLGLFISVGLIIDSTFPIFKFLQISEDLRATNNDRATFLTENPTTLGFFYNFLLISTCYCFYISKSSLAKIFYLLSSILFIVGAFLTGSRQILFIIIFSLIISYSTFSIKKIFNLVIIFLTAIIGLLFFGSKIEKYVSSQSSSDIGERFTGSSIQEDERGLLWDEGLEQFELHNAEYWIFGHGIGATTDKNAGHDEFLLSHFENTFFARFGEAGYFGLYILLFPISYCLMSFFRQRKTVFLTLMLTSVISYVFISYISPNGAAPQTQATLFITLSFIIYRKYYDIDLKEKRYV